jgi:hypothetical protein
LDASTGVSIWNYTTGWPVFSSPAVAGGMVYVGSLDGSVYCLDASTGVSIWNYLTDSYVESSPAVAGGMVYVGSLDGSVYCLDASTGVSIWNYTTGGGVYSSPAVAGGMVYVGSYDFKVYAFEPPFYDVTIKAHCNTEGVDVIVPITMDGSPSGHSTAYTFTGLTGTHTFAVPSTDANGHPFLNWSTGQTTTTITVSSGGTYVAYYSARARPYTPQPSYLNSTISVYSADGKAPGTFDDQLKSWIKQYIVPKGYHDMKFVFGECFGGGIIDEMLEFGNDAHPVVAMSASKYDEKSYGEPANTHDYFLEALKNDLRDNPDHTMGQAFDKAKANDPCAPGGDWYNKGFQENPQYNSAGAGADNLKLGNKGTATSYKAILFAGQPDQRHWNDMDGMYNLLVGKFGFTDADIEVCAGNGQYNGGKTLPGGGTIDRGGTAADLENAVKAVAAKMTSNEQLFFWVTDHGDFDGLIAKGLRYITKTAHDLYFKMYDWMTSIMKKITTNYPFIKMFTQNVTSPWNKVYLNGYFVGNLSMVEGEQLLYFDDNIVPLYTDPTNNTLTIELDQVNPLAVSDTYMSSGALPTAIIEGGGVGGIVVPVDKLGLLAPYIGLASTILVGAVATAVYVKRVKRRKERH